MLVMQGEVHLRRYLRAPYLERGVFLRLGAKIRVNVVLHFHHRHLQQASAKMLRGISAILNRNLLTGKKASGSALASVDGRGSKGHRKRQRKARHLFLELQYICSTGNAFLRDAVVLI